MKTYGKEFKNVKRNRNSYEKFDIYKTLHQFQLHNKEDLKLSINVFTKEKVKYYFNQITKDLSNVGKVFLMEEIDNH